MCLVFRDPRREDHTIWTGVTPGAVFTVNVRHPTRLRVTANACPLARKSASQQG